MGCECENYLIETDQETNYEIAYEDDKWANTGHRIIIK